MRWQWWTTEPVPGERESWPDHGRDPSGRLIDGDRVRPEGWRGWEDDLLAAEVAEAAVRALAGPTQIVPTPTPAQLYRSKGGRR